MNKRGRVVQMNNNRRKKCFIVIMILTLLVVSPLDASAASMSVQYHGPAEIKQYMIENLIQLIRMMKAKFQQIRLIVRYGLQIFCVML